MKNIMEIRNKIRLLQSVKENDGYLEWAERQSKIKILKWMLKK